MNVILEAKEKFDQGNYFSALKLFKEAQKTVGTGFFEYHINKCKEKLGSYQDLDCITSLLLKNKNDDQSGYQALLEYYQGLTQIKSEKAKTYKAPKKPEVWPKGLSLAPLPRSTNDYEWYRAKHIGVDHTESDIGLSIIVPTYNRKRILDITLAALRNQRTEFDFEVIVADDGSGQDILSIVSFYEKQMDIKYVRQPDKGYQLCAIRNLGLRSARYPFVAILDCDMAPNTLWVENYLSELLKNENVALIGPRKYIDTTSILVTDLLDEPNLLSSLPETYSDEVVGRRNSGGKSIDWRLEHFDKTENLRLCNSPFRFFSGGNVAFAKKWLSKAGYFDEDFNQWGGEDNEFGYRLYRAGCFFKSLEGGLAYHQEPEGAENETDRAAGKAITIRQLYDKAPYFYRKLDPIKESTIKSMPLVSIYIPAYNCADTIELCVMSALNQTITDLEVCICDDGSTDETLKVLKEKFGKNPRVRFKSQENGGIGKASNTAVKMCKGYYIGQLDSDDYLEPDAVELCLNEFLKNRNLACVYTTNRNVDPHGTLIKNGYNYPEYSREVFTTAMICHHFRMFTARAWNLTEGFDENILNAVDYDMYLKLSEIGPFKHVNKICYNRVLHGNNTSIKQLRQQKNNHFVVVNKSLKRQGISNYIYSPISQEDHCRKFIFNKSDN